MKGRNRLLMDRKEMLRAVQLYADVIFRVGEQVTVEWVGYDESNGRFIVDLIERKTK